MPPFLTAAGVQTLPDIEEINLFKDDNTVVHIKKPNSKCSFSPVWRVADLTRWYSPILDA